MSEKKPKVPKWLQEKLEEYKKSGMSFREYLLGKGFLTDDIRQIDYFSTTILNDKQRALFTLFTWELLEQR